MLRCWEYRDELVLDGVGIEDRFDESGEESVVDFSSSSIYSKLNEENKQ
jgi:hypothetical protein